MPGGRTNPSRGGAAARPFMGGGSDSRAGQNSDFLDPTGTFWGLAGQKHDFLDRFPVRSPAAEKKTPGRWSTLLTLRSAASHNRSRKS